MAACCSADVCGACAVGSVLSAITTRVVFCMHSLVAFWRITVTTEWSHFYWLLLTGLLGLLLETTVTLCVRKGQEYKWFCPSVFFYLCTIVPSVWILELNRLKDRITLRDWAEKGYNISALKLQDGNQQIKFDLPGLASLGNYSVIDIKVPIEISTGQWVVMIEQLLLFVLILGRWMLPKGDISRDELSQLLLVYIGMAADIIEFFEAFKEDKVKYNWTLIMTILGIWSSSLLQFCLVLTASKSSKSRAGFMPVKDHDHEAGGDGCCGSCCGNCCGTEVVGIITTMMLQDGPFLTLRLLLLFRYEVNSYMHIFFTVKNTLVLLLMVYRLYVLFDARRDTRRRHLTEYLHLDDVGSARSTDPPRRKQTTSDVDGSASVRSTDLLQRRCVCSSPAPGDDGPGAPGTRGPGGGGAGGSGPGGGQPGTPVRPGPGAPEPRAPGAGGPGDWGPGGSGPGAGVQGDWGPEGGQPGTPVRPGPGGPGGWGPGAGEPGGWGPGGLGPGGGQPGTPVRQGDGAEGYIEGTPPRSSPHKV